jgi:hypothetical protein
MLSLFSGSSILPAKSLRPEMATDRQIAANRRNARRSTGPRSHGGKKRASRNAYQHGLSLGIGSIAAFAREVESLTRKLAEGGDDELMLERAGAVAEAEVDVARAQRAKGCLLDRIAGPLQESFAGSAAMAPQQPRASAEVLRRALSEFVKLDRYARRAASRRDRAIGNLRIAQERKFKGV